MQRVADHNAMNMGFEIGKIQFPDLIQMQYCIVEGLGYKAPVSTCMIWQLPFTGPLRVQ